MAPTPLLLRGLVLALGLAASLAQQPPPPGQLTPAAPPPPPPTLPANSEVETRLYNHLVAAASASAGPGGRGGARRSLSVSSKARKLSYCIVIRLCVANVATSRVPARAPALCRRVAGGRDNVETNRQRNYYVRPRAAASRRGLRTRA